MQTLRYLLPLLFLLPLSTFAQVNPNGLIAIGLLLPKSACAKQFPDLKLSLKAAFGAFTKRNKRYFTPKGWRELAETPFPVQRTFKRQECDQYVTELSAMDADLILERTEREVACQRTVEETYERLELGRPAIGINLSEGVLEPRVASVRPLSPAESAGIQPGDVIRSYSGVSVQSACDLFLAVLRSEIRRPAEITVSRSGRDLHFTVTPETTVEK